MCVVATTAAFYFIAPVPLLPAPSRRYDWGVSHEQNPAVQRLFDELIELHPPARKSRLDELRLNASHVDASDPADAPRSAAIDEVVALLAAADRAGDFLGVLADPSLPERPERAAGSIIAARYRIERRLGGGGMGDVYLARDRELDRDVALKFFRAPDHFDASGQPRFITEARVVARLDHPHVATVHDVGESEDGQPFIAMTYYAGATLQAQLAHGTIPIADAVRIASQIAAALTAAHAADIIHCDVKPANVLFDAGGAVRLADFGVARVTTADARTDPGTAAGTVAYMSPEQARGDSLDGRTDLWSLGVILYEMIAGRRPFAGQSTDALMHALLHDEPAPLPASDIASAPDLKGLITNLLAKDAAQRPPTAAAVHQTLASIAAEYEAASARAPGGRRTGSLPHAVTSFIGREREIETARTMLRETRLLTLTGPGGTGKTRLALQLGTLLRDKYPDGVWLVPLAGISDPGLVPSMVAQTLGIRDLGGGMSSGRVIAALRESRMLLLLDNFEHLLGARTFVSTLLAACANVSILVTSRAPLNIQGEQELPVPPLTVPPRTSASNAGVGHEDAAAAASEAVQLFVQRTRAVRPDFVLDRETVGTVVEICRKLDGLPLALELAAARARLLSPRAMLSRLERRFDLLRADAADRPARHSTMRNVIDWSYVLLTDAERTLFNRLAVFAGGISVEAARSIARPSDASAPAPANLDLLDSLCSKSLLRYEEQPDGAPRFVMLETMREFGLERLRETGDDADARRAHRAYYLSLAEGAATQLRGAEQAAWMDRIEAEYADCRLALDDALDAATSGSQAGLVDAARMVIALHRVWLTRGPLLEGVEYLRRTIAAADVAARDPAMTGLETTLRARLLTSAAQVANTRSVFPEARDLFERGLELYRDVGDRRGVATTLNNLAWSVWVIGDLARGESLSIEAMAMHHEMDDPMGATLSLNNLAWIAMERGQYARAEDYFGRVQASHRARGDKRAIAFSVGWMGQLSARRGDLDRAIPLYVQAIEMLEPIADRGYRTLCLGWLASARHAALEPGDHADAIASVHLPALRGEGRLWPIATTLVELGRMLRDDGQLTRSHDALVEALEVRRQTGALQGVPEASRLLGTVYHHQGNRARAAESLAHGLGTAMDMGAIPTAVDCIEAIAALVLDDGRADAAALMLGTVMTARNEFGMINGGRSEQQREAIRTALTTMIGSDALEANLQLGAAMSVTEAGAMAMEQLQH